MIKGVKKNGFILLEIIIATALIVIVFVILLGIGVLVLGVSGSAQKEIQADFLVKEELEAARNFRDGTTWATSGLGTVATGSSNPYHFENNLDSWSLVAGAETTGIFTRQIIFDKVSRDAGGYIESDYNASNNDNDTIKATVIVSWSGKTLQVVSYFTNWKK